MTDELTSRRGFLRASVAAGTLAVAGCSESGDSRAGDASPNGSTGTPSQSGTEAGSESGASIERTVGPPTRLVADDPSTGERFGSGVAVGDGVALVGRRGDYRDGRRAGSLTVFERADGEWVEGTTIGASDPADGAGFGGVVDVDGDVAVVGAKDDDEQGRHAGAAYVFRRRDGDWSQAAKLTADATTTWFGGAVSVSGSTAIVGATSYGGNQSSPGAATVFERGDDGWTRQATLTVDDVAGFDGFGSTVDVDGDVAVVGAPDHDAAGEGSGAAYVFERSSGQWSDGREIGPDSGQAGESFGKGVAIDGERILVAAPSRDRGGTEQAGAVFEFERVDGEWSQRGTLAPAEPTEQEKVGNVGTVAVDGSLALAGANSVPMGDADTAWGYVFERSAGQWHVVERIDTADLDGDDWYPGAVAIHGELGLFGAPQDDEPAGNDSGSAYLYEL
ncbi:hypothetical protein BV210_07900 [Halorientalis sp. IM1011]|uniref:FG-GAP repeat protein n=1 Tax=Halorientalis sp. IM1011 TaxID=1932360 RepID=UPI00097CCE15|nr:FG-GAP repeat protein [Halorientalis sp. IM1011]AQL42637.1 hypothetical protein BV210_07900 [Halorientalis sp. IM1011]